MKLRLMLLMVVAAMGVQLSVKGFGETLSLPDFKSGNAVWIIRAGVGFNNTAGSAIGTQKAMWDNDDWNGSFKSTTGYILTVGFNKSFGENPLYWGMELGFGTRGYNAESKYHSGKISSWGDYIGSDRTRKLILSTYNVQLSPFTIGYKYTFLERMAADVHIGAYAAYDVMGNYKDKYLSYSYSSGQKRKSENNTKRKISDMDSMHKYDAGLNLGFGYWFGHFNVDFTWQRGFIPIYEGGDKTVNVGKKSMKQGDYFTNNFQLKLGYAF